MTQHPNDLPYEDNPEPVDVDLDPHTAVCSGLVVMASGVRTVLGNMPGLVFRFALPDGAYLPDILLLLDPGDPDKVGALVTAAAASAHRAARRT